MSFRKSIDLNAPFLIAADIVVGMGSIAAIPEFGVKPAIEFGLLLIAFILNNISLRNRQIQNAMTRHHV